MISSEGLQLIKIISMRHFRPEDQEINLEEEQKVSYQQKLSKSLKSITSLLPFVELTVNYGFAVENVWVTMLMITHKTPDEVDSFIWILPIVIAILIRPYIVRFVHQLSYKVYRQISMVSLFLIIGAIGCYLVGESCRYQKKSDTTRRIIMCIIGWTLMDLSFEFCQYFAEKIQESSKDLENMEKDLEKDGGKGESQGESLNKRQNYEFYGLFLGYVVSLLICWITHGRTVKQFYKCCKYAYWTVAGLSFITGLRLFIESNITLPERSIQQEIKSQKTSLNISISPSYYLPGLQELLHSDLRTALLLLLHAVVLFLNDVIMIYTTMWFSQPAEAEYKRHGEALIAGLEYGSLALLGYTIIDNLKVRKRHISSGVYLKLSMGFVLLASLLTFYLYNYVTFSLLAVSVGILNQFYRHTVFNIEYEENNIFERCIEIVERAEKIYVLAVMPPIIMLGLQRNDIQDCLLWAAGMAALGIFAFSLAKGRSPQDQQRGANQTVKVTKVE